MCRISRYSYLLETLISSEYGLTISGHVTVLRQWLLDKNKDFIITISSDSKQDHIESQMTLDDAITSNELSEAQGTGIFLPVLLMHWILFT